MKKKILYIPRARTIITSHFASPIRPAWLRYFSSNWRCQSFVVMPCRTGVSTPQIWEFIIALALSFAFLLALFISSAFAQGQENFYYYLVPPASSISVNDELIRNTSYVDGLMVFRQEAQEIVEIDADVLGARIVSKQFQVDISGDVTIHTGETLNLQAGSIHVMTLPNSTDESTIELDDLSISFQSADFLLYVSRDQSEKTIKVIEGELEISNPATNQKATLKSKEATSTDVEGRLLIPSPYEPEEGGDWWNDSSFDFDFDRLPIAHAGDDQRVLGNISVVLNGSKSDFKTGNIFEWTLIRGPKDVDGNEVTEVAFDSTNIVKPLFTPKIDGEYHFTLQITNALGEKSNLDKVIVFVGRRYLRPIAIFPDVPAEHENNLAITYLYKKNVMRGSEDPETGKFLFRPDDTINRVEILKTVFENKKQEIPGEEELRSLEEGIFLDVKPEHWFAPYVYLAKKQGIVKGNDGLYRPADEVLLVEALKIIIKTNQISLDSYEDLLNKPYRDTELGAWYNPYLFFVKKYNLVDVDADGNIIPAQELSRAKFAEIIYRMESINLLEKRGFLSGILTNEDSKVGIPNAEIYIYKAIEEDGEGEGFVEKGELYFKTTTKSDGSFSASLPIHTKYYVEAISGDNVSTNKIITELEEDLTTEIELGITE